MPGLLWLLPLLGMFALYVVGITVQRQVVESTLLADAREGLAAVDVDPDTVELSMRGRDARLAGEVATVELRDAAIAAVAATTGVREVEVDGLTSADDVVRGAVEDEEEPTPTPAPSADAAVDVVVDGADGTLLLAGRLGSRAELDRLSSTVRGVVGVAYAFVTDVDVDPSTGPLTGAAVTVSGDAPDTDTALELRSALAALVPDGSVTSDELLVGGVGVVDEPDAGDGEPTAAPSDAPGEGTADDPWLTFFESNSAEVVDESGSMAEAAAALAAAPAGTEVAVVGFADQVGNPQDNLTLATLRADAVAELLAEAAPEVTFDVRAEGEEGDPPPGLPTSRRVAVFLP